MQHIFFVSDQIQVRIRLAKFLFLISILILILILCLLLTEFLFNCLLVHVESPEQISGLIQKHTSFSDYLFEIRPSTEYSTLIIDFLLSIDCKVSSFDFQLVLFSISDLLIDHFHPFLRKHMFELSIVLRFGIDMVHKLIKVLINLSTALKTELSSHHLQNRTAISLFSQLLVIIQ